MYSLQTINNLYAVIDENNNEIASYAYRSQAKDHLVALKQGVEFISRPIEIYEDLG
jgi:hypothetical protein